MGLIHATCVKVDGVGILLRGPPGSGKTDLALRLMDQGADLVADDQVEIRVDEGAVLATAPEALKGFIEVRGLGIITVPCVPSVRVELVVDLEPTADISRLPAPAKVAIEGVELPVFSVSPFEGSAVIKLRLAVKADRHGILRNK